MAEQYYTEFIIALLTMYLLIDIFDDTYFGIANNAAVNLKVKIFFVLMCFNIIWINT